MPELIYWEFTSSCLATIKLAVSISQKPRCYERSCGQRLVFSCSEDTYKFSNIGTTTHSLAVITCFIDVFLFPISAATAVRLFRSLAVTAA